MNPEFEALGIRELGTGKLLPYDFRLPPVQAGESLQELVYRDLREKILQESGRNKSFQQTPVYQNVCSRCIEGAVSIGALLEQVTDDTRMIASIRRSWLNPIEFHDNIFAAGFRAALFAEVNDVFEPENFLIATGQMVVLGGKLIFAKGLEVAEKIKMYFKRR